MFIINTNETTEEEKTLISFNILFQIFKKKKNKFQIFKK